MKLDIRLKAAFELISKKTKNTSLSIKENSIIAGKYPDQITELLKNNGEILFQWTLEEDIPVVECFEDTTFGEFHFGPEAFDYDAMAVWAQSVEDDRNAGEELYVPIDLFKAFPLQQLGNGDMLVLSSEKQEVFYLSSDDDWVCKRLANDLISFYEVWIQLYCPGPEFWCLEPFYDYESNCLSLELETSKKWLSYIKECE